MGSLSDIVQKAFYLGVGLAATAGEKAGEKLTELRAQAQKLADEMVAKGEMTAEESRRFVDEMVKQAQQPTVEQSTKASSTEPRRIEIIDDDEPVKNDISEAEAMRKQVEALQEELRRLKRS
jgi:polyhydroxyalkanoate synthesis regulator phasin